MVNFFPKWCVLNIIVITLNAFIIILHFVAGSRMEARKEHWRKSRWMQTSTLLFKRCNKVAFSQQVKPASQLVLLFIQKKNNVSTEENTSALPFNAPLSVYRNEIVLHCWEPGIHVLSAGTALAVRTAGLFASWNACSREAILWYLSISNKSCAKTVPSSFSPVCFRPLCCKSLISVALCWIVP